MGLLLNVTLVLSHNRQNNFVLKLQSNVSSSLVKNKYSVVGRRNCREEQVNVLVQDWYIGIPWCQWDEHIII